MKIFKYRIEFPICAVEMPYRAEILSCQLQNGEITIWASFDKADEFTKETRKFIAVGTGGTFEPSWKFLATVQRDRLVWHIFEIP